jgi:hypothetical protein
MIRFIMSNKITDAIDDVVEVHPVVVTITFARAVSDRDNLCCRWCPHFYHSRCHCLVLSIAYISNKKA